MFEFDRGPVHRGVELVECVGVFDYARALARFGQPFGIFAALRYGSEIVRRSVQHENRPRDVLVVSELCAAYRVSRYVSDEMKVGTPKIPLPVKRPAIERAAACEDGSLSCSWAKLTAAVKNAFASTKANR